MNYLWSVCQRTMRVFGTPPQSYIRFQSIFILVLRKSDLVRVEQHDYGDLAFPSLMAFDRGVRVKERIIARGYSSTQLLFQSHLVTATITRTCTTFPPDFIWKKPKKKTCEMKEGKKKTFKGDHKK